MSYNVDAGQFSWYNAYTPTGVVYIATRTDGISGDGSIFNPLDASTVDKFDKILSGTNVKEDTTYILYPGIYYTHGCLWGHRGLKRGVRIIGNSTSNTTIKLSPTWSNTVHGGGYNGGRTIALLGSLYDGGNEYSQRGIEISNITLDGNYPNLISQSTGFTIHAIHCFADDVKLNSVISQNTSDRMDQAPYTEGFPIYIQGKNYVASDVLIKDHRRIHGHTAFGALSGIFNRCVVDFRGMNNGGGYSHAFGVVNGSFHDCRVYGCSGGNTEGIYGDTPDGVLSDIYVENCQFHNVISAITYLSFPTIRTKFIRNYVQLSTGSNPISFAGILAHITNSNQEDMEISYNTFDHVGSSTGAYAIRMIETNKRVKFLFNTLKTGLAVYINESGGNCYAMGNQYTDGAIPYNAYNGRRLGFDLSGVTVPHP